MRSAYQNDETAEQEDWFVTEQEHRRMERRRREAARRRRAKAIRKRRIVLFIMELFILLLLLGVVFIVTKLQRINKTDLDMDKVGVNEGISQEAQEVMKGYKTIALFGLDNRSNGNLSKGRSDVIMIANINNDTKEVKLVSVFRDTFLDVGEGSFQKCNAAYAKGGPEQALTMLNKNLDLNITDYVTVDFEAIVECVDLLGGITIPEMTDDEASLTWGYIKEINELTGHKSPYLDKGGTNVELDGVQACAYARIRYTAGNDYRRAERQRAVLAAMVEKAQQSDILTVNKVINQVFGDIQTSFSNAELVAMAAQMFNYKITDSTGFPFSKTTRIVSKKKGDVVIPCDLSVNVSLLHQYLFEDEEYTVSDTVKKNNDLIIKETGVGLEDRD